MDGSIEHHRREDDDEAGKTDERERRRAFGERYEVGGTRRTGGSANEAHANRAMSRTAGAEASFGSRRSIRC